MVTESVKVDKEQLDRVRKHVAATPMTIGGYISVLIRENMDKIDLKTAKKQQQDAKAKS